jgi:hypothetical protein
MVVSGNREAAKVKTWPVVMAPLAIILVLAVVWNSAVQSSEATALQELSELEAQYSGAEALTDPQGANPPGQPIEFVPGLDVAAKDRPSFYSQGCHQKSSDEPGAEEVLVCDLDNYGDNKTVVLTGGSYAAQWYPAIQEIAKQQGWRLLVIEKSGCRLTTESQIRSCREWNESAIDVISSYRPDAVFTLATVVYYQKLEDFHRGMINQISALEARGIRVFGLRGTPKFVFDVPECLEKSNLDQELCSRPRDELYPQNRQYPEELIGLENFRLLDLTDAICEETVCRPVVGNVLVYRDRGHMTATYVKTLTEPLLAAIREADPGFIAG